MRCLLWIGCCIIEIINKPLENAIISQSMRITALVILILSELVTIVMFMKGIRFIKARSQIILTVLQVATNIMLSTWFIPYYLYLESFNGDPIKSQRNCLLIGIEFLVLNLSVLLSLDNWIYQTLILISTHIFFFTY